MKRTHAVLLGACLLAVAAAVAPVAASHGSQSNFTATPHDRQPGMTDATYEQHAVSPISFQRLDSLRATYEEGGFTGCGVSNSEVFGIDRKNDEPGTTIDHDLTQNAKKHEVGEDTFYVDFYDESDFGSSTNLAEGDEFVSLTENCFDNPAEPGWYQIESTIEGTAPNGSKITAHDVSHYFYVCDCAGEREARQTLGPPPSEPQSTATPTATPEPTPTRTPPSEGTPFPSPTPTPTSQSSSTPTDAPDRDRSGASRTAASSGGGGQPATATPTPENWDSYVKSTPTVGSGPGFGVAGSLVALLALALVGVRRR